jgi:glycosyltransferase involved in cell wall biosynthesis
MVTYTDMSKQCDFPKHMVEPIMVGKVKVTIGLCVKNVEATIEEAVDGILSQDFPHKLMELVVVDGYSEDRTLSIIKGMLSKSDVYYRIFNEKTGLGMARQIVVDNAWGEYIIWVDGDILLPNDYVRRQIEFLEKNLDVGIAIGKHGMCPGESLVAAFENITAVVDAEYGDRGASELGFMPGTEGAICRVEAIRQVGGFDVNIEGAAEDVDVSYRVKSAGWSLCRTNEVFQEVCRETWKSLWDQYFWYGYGGYYLLRKDSGMITFYKMVPPAGFLAGVLHSLGAYKLTHRKIVFLLPIHYTFKRIAWCVGFAKAYLDKYGH